MIEFLGSFVSRASAVLRVMVGAPDYARYLQHMRAAHPGDRIMTETEFNHARMNDRYNRPGSRCC
jgi:uncharacterized short protein YbdD (DUF466 family)